MIKPIDLQTLFMKMNEVGKEQIHLKENAAQQQSQEARNQVQKELRKDHSVNKSNDNTESDVIHDQENPTNRQSGQHQKKSSETPEPEEKPIKPEDPELGQHLDITG